MTRNRMRLWVVCCLLLLITVSADVVSAAPSDSREFATGVLELTNAERTRAGLSPLTSNPQLQEAARSYSEVLALSGCFGHTCGPLPDIAERDRRAGYTGWTSLGENIASGYPNPEAVVAGWMASPMHRANILSPDYTEIGVSVSRNEGQSGVNWTQEFGSRN
jgi:uncharacterized protein YkwD